MQHVHARIPLVYLPCAAVDWHLSWIMTNVRPFATSLSYRTRRVEVDHPLSEYAIDTVMLQT